MPRERMEQAARATRQAERFWRRRHHALQEDLFREWGVSCDDGSLAELREQWAAERRDLELAHRQAEADFQQWLQQQHATPQEVTP